MLSEELLQGKFGSEKRWPREGLLHRRSSEKSCPRQDTAQRIKSGLKHLPDEVAQRTGTSGQTWIRGKAVQSRDGSDKSWPKENMTAKYCKNRNRKQDLLQGRFGSENQRRDGWEKKELRDQNRSTQTIFESQVMRLCIFQLPIQPFI